MVLRPRTSEMNLSCLLTGVCILALATVCSLPLAAQQTEAAAQPGRLTINSRLVVLDVVATDASGKPVDGLTKQDFQVTEEGKLQRISAFEAPAGHSLPPETDAAGAGATFDPARPASFGSSPVNVLVLDQINTHFADSSFAQRALREYLTGQPALLPQPTTLLTIGDRRFKTLEPFTRDRNALLRALAAAPTAYDWQLEINGKSAYGPLERLDQSLRVMDQIAQSFAGIRGRKNLVWVGGGFPTLDPSTIDGDNAREVTDTLRHITDVLLDTRMTLYAVDPTSTAAGMTEITDRQQTEFAQLAGDALSINSDTADPNSEFDKLGAITGGRVVRGRNDVAKQIAGAIDLAGHYYTIAYTPDTGSDRTARFRAVKVTCLRPGVTALTRTGYFNAASQQADAVASASYDLSTAAEGKAMLNGLHLRVEKDASDASGNRYLLHVEAAGLAWKPQDDGSSIASVYVMAVAFNAKDKVLGHTLRGMKADAKPGVNPRAPGKDAAFAFELEPHAGTERLRFVVRDSATGLMGSNDVTARTH